jgi:hypothetical protein
MVAFLRQVIAPLLVVLIFVVALVAVSARIWLPSDMMAPAPVSAEDAPNAPQWIMPSESAPQG